MKPAMLTRKPHHWFLFECPCGWHADMPQLIAMMDVITDHIRVHHGVGMSG